MQTVAVIDYGMGNLRSVWQALVHVAQGRVVSRHRNSLAKKDER